MVFLINYMRAYDSEVNYNDNINILCSVQLMRGFVILSSISIRSLSIPDWPDQANQQTRVQVTLFVDLSRVTQPRRNPC
jgi:hypothetical protein